MKNDQPPNREPSSEYNSHLFTVRLWQEAVGPAEAEWRGRIQHVPSGQVSYFRDWSTLVAHLLSMLPAVDNEGRWTMDDGR